MNELETEQLPDSIQQQRNTGDVPIGGNLEASALVESLLSNSHVPKPLINQLWVLFSRTAKLTFLNDEDVNILLLQFELIRLSIIESVTKAEYNEELELTLTQLQMEFFMTLKRSRGGIANERTLLGASSQMTFTEKPLGAHNEPGFIDKIAHILGGGKGGN